MAASLSVLVGLVQIWSDSSVVLFHGTEHLPVADHNHPIGDNKGAIEPGVETVNGCGFHHSPPAQEVARAEEEVIQRQDVGNSIDQQRYNPDGGDYEQSALLGEDLPVKASSFDAHVPIEGRQSPEVDGDLRQNRHCEGVCSADRVTETSLAMDYGVDC